MTEETITLGSSACFAVSLRPYPELGGVFADLMLWLLGKPLGRSDDPMAIYPFLGALEGMARPGRDEMFVAGVLHSPAADAWVRLKAEGSRFKAPSTEFFDRYEMYCVTDEQTVRCLWKDRSEQNGTVHDALLLRSEVDRVIGDLRSVYEALATSQR